MQDFSQDYMVTIHRRNQFGDVTKSEWSQIEEVNLHLVIDLPSNQGEN